MLRWSGLIALSVMVTIGCDDGAPAVPRADAGPKQDAGSDVRDAGRSSDAGPREDSGSRSDGGSQSATTCQVLDQPVLELDRDMRHVEREVAIAPGPDHFGLAWMTSTSVEDELRFSRVPSGSGEPALRTVRAVPLGLDPALARIPEGGWILTWSDNELGGYELRAQALADDGTPMSATPVRLTDNSVRDAASAVVVTDSGSVLASFIEDDMRSGMRRVWVRPLDASAMPTGTAQELVAPMVARTLGMLPDSAVVAWVHDRQAWLWRLDESGSAIATATRLDTEANVSGVPAVTRSSGQAGAVFPVVIAATRAELRFRPLDEEGDPTGPERSLTPAPERGIGPSIASVGGGYVVGYRSYEDGAWTIRLVLVSELGDRIAALDVAPTTAEGGRVRVAVAGDGRILLAWFEAESLPHRLRAARVECGNAS